MSKTKRAADLQEELTTVLLSVAETRNDIPEQCVNLISEKLKLQQNQAEKAMILPKSDVKKLACKYPVNQSIQGIFQLQNNDLAFQEVSSEIAELNMKYENLSKAMRLFDCKNGS